MGWALYKIHGQSHSIMFIDDKRGESVAKAFDGKTKTDKLDITHIPMSCSGPG